MSEWPSAISWFRMGKKITFVQLGSFFSFVSLFEFRISIVNAILAAVSSGFNIVIFGCYLA
jgi:hypothetical protein